MQFNYWAKFEKLRPITFSTEYKIKLLVTLKKKPGSRSTRFLVNLILKKLVILLANQSSCWFSYLFSMYSVSILAGLLQ